MALLNVTKYYGLKPNSKIMEPIGYTRTGERRMSTNPKAPHQAIISVKVEIMERLPDGKVSGRLVSQSNELFTTTGRNLEECNKNVEKTINNIKESLKQCRKKNT